MEKQRLDKFISSQLNITRSEAKNAIRSARVTVNGASIRDCGLVIDVDNSIVCCDGKEVEYKKYIYILMNKPKGVLSASNDKTRQTVVDLVPDNLKRNGLFPVGRLDRDTTGILLITDDGIFAHDVISPKKMIPKSYIATLDGDVTNDMVEKFKNGVILADGTKCKPAVLEPLGNRKARLILCEGKYHEVKRMFGTVDLGVNELHRESIGELKLPQNLEVGKCVEMNKNQLILAQKSTAYTF